MLLCCRLTRSRRTGSLSSCPPRSSLISCWRPSTASSSSSALTVGWQPYTQTFLSFHISYFREYQRWSNIFGFDSDSNLFPRISNIRIRIREFWRPNNIRIFESFSSNLEYLKHIFHLDFEYKLVIFSCPADLLIPFSGTNGQDLCLDVTVTWYL